MDKSSKILISGLHRVVNRALLNKFKKGGFVNVVDTYDQALDLTSQDLVQQYFKDYIPEVIIYTGSVSGGISINIKRPGEFIYKNIVSQTNVINSAKETGVSKLIYFGSSCIYPKHSPQPIKEEYLLTGGLEETSEPYAVSKIAGIKMCEAYNRQYGTNFIAVIPATIYGPEDNFELESAHVISALIKKFHHAKESKQKSVEIWGSGNPRREFIFVDDLADGCLFLLKEYNDNKPINIGTARDYSIAELSEIIAKIVGFDGRIRYNPQKPDGVKQKLLDSGRITSLGWRPKTSIEDGISITYNWYKNYARDRGG